MTLPTRREKNESITQADIHNLLSSVPLEVALNSIQAFIEAQDLSQRESDLVMKFSNAVGLQAWKKI